MASKLELAEHEYLIAVSGTSGGSLTSLLKQFSIGFISREIKISLNSDLHSGARGGGSNV